MQVFSIASEADWAAAKAVRRLVFVEEQRCPPEEEWDEHDAPEARGRTCHHLAGRLGGEVVATARWRPVAWAGRPAAKLERFAVLPAWRGRGLGRTMVAATIREAEAAGFATCLLHAQAHLEAFYEGFGFRRVGEAFEEAGIAHVRMVRENPTVEK